MPTELGPHDLTSDVSHPPFVVSASTTFSYTPEWQAFDGNPATGWLGIYGPWYLQIDLGAAHTLGSYGIVIQDSSAGREPNTWTMQGSPDGTTWTTVDTQAGQTAWTIGGPANVYTCASPGSYRYYRINVTANNGVSEIYCGIGELYLYAGSALIAQTITFAAIPAHLTTDAPFVLAATSDSMLPVSYVVTSGPATLAGSTVTLTGAGSVTITAAQAGNGTYSAATSVPQTFAVTAPVGPPPPPGQWNLLVYDEGERPELNAYVVQQRAGRWFYHRNDLTGTVGGFFGFFFDGLNMCALSGLPGGAAQGFNVADFRHLYAADQLAGGGTYPIECVYQAHYEDCGFPDNDKMWLEVAIDFEFAVGAAANVLVGFNNGVMPPAFAGILTAGPRRTLSFGFPGNLFPSNQDGGVLARNLSVLIDVMATGLALIHNVYLYYYVEARLALVASSIPTDLGVGKDKECKELQLDIDMGDGTALVNIVSDLPGNALQVRESITTAAGGRGIFHYPFPTIQGFLFQIALVGIANATFRLYSARLLMRVIGTFIQAAESAAGFVWDSMAFPLGAGDASTLDELRFEMAIDLAPVGPQIPGPAKVITSGVLSVTSAYTNGPAYVGQQTGAGVITLGAVGLFSSSAEVIRSNGWTTETDTLALTSDNISALTIGTLNLNCWIDGTIFGSNTNPSQLSIYEAWIDVVYADLTTARLEATAQHVDPGSTGNVLNAGAAVDGNSATAAIVERGTFSGGGQSVILGLSMFGFVYGGVYSLVPFVDPPVVVPSATVTLLTDLPGETQTAKGTYVLAIAAASRAWVTVPLPDGIEARSLRIQTTANANYRLYRAQVRHGHIGRYLAGATPSGANDQFRTLEFDLQSEKIHMFKRLEIDLRADTPGAVTMNVFTNQDGVPLANVFTAPLSTPNGRATLLVILPPGIRGRLLRVQLTGPIAARIYKIRAWTRTVQDKDGAWGWLDFPLEDSPVLPVWVDILGPPDTTENTWAWVDVALDVQDGQ